METTVPVATNVAVTQHQLKFGMLDLLWKVVDGASTMRQITKSLATHPCSLVCSKSSVPTICRERLDLRKRKRDTRNGLRNATAGRISSCFEYVQVRMPSFCREDGLHGGLPKETPTASVRRVQRDLLKGPMPFVLWCCTAGSPWRPQCRLRFCVDYSAAIRTATVIREVVKNTG